MFSVAVAVLFCETVLFYYHQNLEPSDTECIERASRFVISTCYYTHTVYLYYSGVCTCLYRTRARVTTVRRIAVVEIQLTRVSVCVILYLSEYLTFETYIIIIIVIMPNNFIV